MNINSDKKKVAEMLKQAFSGCTNITNYYDNNKESSIHIFQNDNYQNSSLKAFSTVGLYKYPIGLKVKSLDLGIEIVGVSSSSVFSNVIASCAFNIINTQYSCAPDTVFYNIITPYVKDSDMKHILFVNPFLWQKNLKNIEMKEHYLTWLHAIPISESELSYAEDNGFDSLEDLFQDRGINIADINRKSVI